MRYVSRDASGEICAVYAAPRPDAQEALPDQHPELIAFVGADGAAARMVASDLALVRVIEDVIDLLVSKGVILFTELPAPARQKLLERGHLRRALNTDMMVDDDPLL